jgi:hypothetical protein
MSDASRCPDHVTAMIGAQQLHGELLDPSTANVWQSIEPISREDCDALPVEETWLRAGVGAGAMDEHWFMRSPGADEDAPMEERDIGGHRFCLCARPASAPSQREGPRHLLVEKHHVLRFVAGREIPVLRLPDGQRFVHVVEGGEDKPPLVLPEGWRLEALKLSEDWVLQLPTPTSVFFFRNGDSYQGPLAELPRQADWVWARVESGTSRKSTRRKRRTMSTWRCNRGVSRRPQT